MSALSLSLRPRPSVKCLYFPKYSPSLRLVPVEAIRPGTRIDTVSALDTDIWVAKKVSLSPALPAYVDDR